MRLLTILGFLIGEALSATAQQTFAAKPGPVIASVSVIQEKYCPADNDVFSVLIRFKIEVANSSQSATQLLWPMIPWIGKVASSMEEARAGHFLFEQTPSIYPQKSPHFRLLKINPGKSVKVDSKYFLVGRYKPNLLLSGTLSAGSYGLILVLQPEEEPPLRYKNSENIRRLTTEPFLVSVPSAPKIAPCESGDKSK